MLRFLLFCTMLIFTCEAFRPQFHGSQTLSVKKESSPSYSYSDNELYIPVKLISPRNNMPYYEPRLHPSDRTKHLYNDLFTKKGFYHRKRKKNSSPPTIMSNSLQYFRPRKPKFRPHNFLPNHKFFKRRNLSNYPEIIIRKRNQYYICPYSLFKSDSPRTMERWNRKRKIRLPVLKEQCEKLESVRLKNKRSAKKTKSKREHDHQKNQVSAPVVDSKTVNVSLKNEVNNLENSKPKHSISSATICPNSRSANHTLVPVSKTVKDAHDTTSSHDSPITNKDLILNLRESQNVHSESKKTDESDDEDDSKEVSEGIIKLKQKLEEVENVLNEENPDLLDGESISELFGSRSSSKDETIPKMSDDDIKAKIDKIAIPMLVQISEKLSQCKSGSSQGGSGSSQEQKKLKIKVKEKDKEESTEKKKKGKTDINTSETEKLQSCVPDGTWYSGALKLQLNVSVLPSLLLQVKVKSCKPNNLVNKKWIMQGLTLSKHGGPLILAGIYPEKRRIASFIGQCRVTKGDEFVFGSWTVTSCAQRLSGLWTSMETKNDVWTRSPSWKEKEKINQESVEDKEEEKNKKKHHDKVQKHHHQEHEKKHQHEKTEEKEEHEKKGEKEDEKKDEKHEKKGHEKKDHDKKEHHKKKDKYLEDEEKKSQDQKENEEKEEKEEKSFD